MANSPAFEKYLDKHAEKEALCAFEGRWDVGVAVPMLDENRLIDGLLDSLSGAASSAGKKVLAVIVVNARAVDGDELRLRNRDFLDRFEPNEVNPFDDALDLWLIDRSTAPNEFPEDEGVGLARKIGCDLLCSLYQRGRIRSPWFRTTDADVRVHSDYFDDIEDQEGAFHYRYEHIFDFSNKAEAESLLLYEIKLRHYENGLRYAESPYAFPTLGSAICVHADSYAKVRGFPKLRAAEDFYILNKLAQVAPVQVLARRPISILQRPSFRVPFGTGQGMEKIEKQLAQGEPFDLYDPKCFEALKRWLILVKEYSVTRDIFKLREQVQSTLGEVVYALLDEWGTFTAFEEALNHRKDAEQLLRHCHTWFDALRTLKLIHGLRDLVFPNLPFEKVYKYSPEKTLIALRSLALSKN